MTDGQNDGSGGVHDTLLQSGVQWDGGALRQDLQTGLCPYAPFARCSFCFGDDPAGVVMYIRSSLNSALPRIAG